MSLLRKTKISEVKNTGFGNNADIVGNRLVNKEGIPNTTRKGLQFLEGISWYHTLLRMQRWKFISCLFLAFLAINVVFALAYYLIGIHHLNGIAAGTPFEKISKVYFFSIQTFTTVGYGHISPDGFAASVVSSIEAFTGLLFFALATGLLYGRFSRPKAYIKFSEHALISPYEDIKGLMFRIVPFKNNHLTEAEVKLSLSVNKLVDGKRRAEFYNLKTEIDKINSLVLSWTIVHPINEESPLYGLNYEEICNQHIELLVFMKAFDETFSSTVMARTSYLYNEIVYGAKFIPMYKRSTNAATTIINVDQLNNYNKVELLD
jgi:Inward rectifier potassium channel C-terminal domain/Ion channel